MKILEKNAAWRRLQGIRDPCTSAVPNIHARKQKIKLKQRIKESRKDSKVKQNSGYEIKKSRSLTQLGPTFPSGSLVLVGVDELPNYPNSALNSSTAPWAEIQRKMRKKHQSNINIKIKRHKKTLYYIQKLKSQNN